MRGIDFFTNHYLCSPEEFIYQLNLSQQNLIIPSYLCAHPRPTILRHIRECILIDLVQPYGTEPRGLICTCIPSNIEPSASFSETIQAYFEEIESAWDEPFYLLLDDLEICPINPEMQCQYYQQH
jgi:hypothetical protein